MEKPALLGVARRRWYVLVLGFIASLALGYGASTLSPPQYSARALVMLLPPLSTVEEAGNPFLALSNLDLPARVVVASVSSTSVRDEVAEQHPEISYTITMEESTRGPVIAIDVNGTAEQETLAALPTLVQQTTSTLERLQNEVDAPAGDSVRSMLLTQDGSATVQRGGTVRAAIASVVLGLVATVLLASAIDGRRLARRRRTSSEEGREPPGAEPLTAPVPDPGTRGEPDLHPGPLPVDDSARGEDHVDQPGASLARGGAVTRAEAGDVPHGDSSAALREARSGGGRNGRTRGKTARARKSR